MAEDTSEKAAERAGLVQAHPDVVERYARLNALFFEGREARRSGSTLPEAAQAEARDLLRWADAIAAEFLGDPEASRCQVQRDEAAFALALRLTGDGLMVRQVLAAAADLRSVV